MKKKTFLAILSILITLSISGCDPIMFIPDFFAELFNPDLIIIRGDKIISGEGKTYTIPKGTTVKFKDNVLWGNYNEKGSLELTDGAKLIAQGTAEEPIVLKESNAGGHLIFDESSNGSESIIEYCSFEGVTILCSTSVVVQFCKFNDTAIICYRLSKSTIQYNSLFASRITIMGEATGNRPTAMIQYNDIDCNNDYFFENGIGLGYVSSSTTIKSNNIINTYKYAIDGLVSQTPTQTVYNNYISDCNGETGVDTDGSQCWGVVYDSYSTTPIAEAGCGW